MSISRALLSRFYHDWTELVESPYPGVAVFSDEADIRQFCLVLTPPSGPWKDLALHFDVELLSDWPTSPPRISSSVSGIKHPNLFGGYICCDLLKEQYFSEKGYTGGYTPALTLRGLFLQFLTFFSSTKVEQEHGDSVQIGDHMVTSYRLDNDIAKSLTHTKECRLDAICSCVGRGQNERELESAWCSSPSKDITTLEYGSSVIHTARETNLGRIHRFERRNPRWQSTFDLISRWQCRKCLYGSSTFPVSRSSPQPTTHPMEVDHLVVAEQPPNCLLEKLDEDILLELSTHLASEALISFSQAYSRLYNLIEQAHVLLQRELHCFFLRTPLRSSVLGIGVALDPNSRMFSSDFDWLSMEAFDHYRVRKSIEKRAFQYFLPLAFSRPHFESVRGEIWARLSTLDKALYEAEQAVAKRTGRALTRWTGPSRQPHHTVDVIYRMMNNIVVSLMSSCDDVYDKYNRSFSGNATLLYASEKAVISYCQLFHLLISLSRTEPAILSDAADRLRHFIQTPGSRVKKHVPDLGELIVLITLVLACPQTNGPPVAWDVLNGPFLQEAIVRNVRWVLKDIPELEVMEQGVSDYRLQNTFLKSRTSLRLIMFQITFLDVFNDAYAQYVGLLADNYGFPEKGIPERVVEAIKEIYQVETWPAFFRRAQYTRGAHYGKEKFSQMLRDAVRESGTRNYHKPKSARELEQLRHGRTRLERAWRSVPQV